MATCLHANEVNVPRAGAAVVHKDECCQCFNTAKSPGGHCVCLTCFTGGCGGAHAHAARHAAVTKHHVFLRHTQTPVAADSAQVVHLSSAADLASPAAAAAAAAAAAGPQYTDTKSAFCHTCQLELSTDPAVNPKLAESIAAVFAADSASKIEEPVDYSVEKPSPCAHTEALSARQQALGAALPDLSNAQLAKCTECDLCENLWLCLTTGNLGCSRRDYDGSGGNNHAVDYAGKTGHSLVLKVGTITPEGKADIWCYDCDRAVEDPDLASHLAAFGIQLADQRKTTKTLAELSLERNLAATLQSVHDPTGRELSLLFGPRLTGIVNIGNSCYMSSVIQCLAGTPSFQLRFAGAAGREHLATCRNQRPGACYLCQMSKVFAGLASGDYALPPSRAGAAEFIRRQRATKDRTAAELAAAGAAATAGATAGAGAHDDEHHQHLAKAARLAADGDAASAHAGGGAGGLGAGVTTADLTPLALQPGVALRALKKLFCADHPDFAGTRQQCAYEFLGFLRDKVQRQEAALRERAADPFDNMVHYSATRVQCRQCRGVRYTHGKATDLVLPLPAATVAAEREARAAAACPGPAGLMGALPPVSFEACMREFAGPTQIEGFNCPACREKTVADVTTGLRTVPETLVMQVRRFGLFDPSSWVPTKLMSGVVFGNGQESATGQLLDSTAAAAGAPMTDADVDPASGLVMPEADAPIVDLTPYILSGPAPGEVELPSDGPAAAGSSNGGLLDKMAGVPAETVEMICGFTGMDEQRVRYALVQCSGDADRAAEWLFSHMDDNIDIAELGAQDAASAVNAGKTAAGGAPTHAGSARFRLKALVCHEGASTLSGHYVAYVHHGAAPTDAAAAAEAAAAVAAGEVAAEAINTGKSFALSTQGSAEQPCEVSGKKIGWVCYNDQKVFQAPNAATGQAYIFFFERV